MNFFAIECFLLVIYVYILLPIHAFLSAESNTRKSVVFIHRAIEGESFEKHLQYRKISEQHFQARSKVFKELERAQKSGDISYARKLAGEAHLYTEKMEMSNMKAVEQILLGQKKNIDTLDLHGLFVSEAKEILPDYVAENAGRKLNVITGQGLHSDISRGPKLRSAILELCDVKKWKYDASDNGSINIHCPEMIEAPYSASEHIRLKIGNDLPADIWGSFVTHVGEKFNVYKLKTARWLVLYVDPVALSYRTKEVYEEFKNIIPSCKLVILTCDSSNDLRKARKKWHGDERCILLSDPSKISLSAFNCRTEQSLVPVLMIVDLVSMKIARVWYANDWELYETSTVVNDELTELMAS